MACRRHAAVRLGLVAGADAFQGVVSHLDYPMFIATTASEQGERDGCLVGFATQCSIDPPRFLVCISKRNHTHAVAMEAEELVVHFLPEGEDELAELFGGETGDEIDKFERCEWHEGPHGVPIVAGLPNWFVGRIVERLVAGDHDALILEPVGGERQAEEDEFTFHRAKRIEPGHAP
jgi:flavin reductase (DIM6/NTAB) family NADH-FMN oxidoreductase RutF